ncbi:MAG: hypothetical protein ACI8TX_002030 [Hyphomicrobiaceae bacterium]
MVVFYLWRHGLLARLDLEKLLYFVGVTGNPLFLSRRSPMIRRVSWWRALFDPRYARSLARWLAWRAELYDGLSG